MRVLATGALVAIVALVAVVAAGTWRDFCRGISLESADGVPGCSWFVSGPSVEVTFPAGWRAVEISPSVYREVQRAAMPANVALGGGPWVSAVAVGWDEQVQSGCVAMAAEASGSKGSIPPFIYPPEVGWNTVLRAAGRPVPSASTSPSWTAAERDELTLPAGPATSVVHFLPHGRSGTQYLVADSGGSLVLACYSDTTPPDRWLSIAQTMRLMPD